jgi:hypothetical protein
MDATGCFFLFLFLSAPLLAVIRKNGGGGGGGGRRRARADAAPLHCRRASLDVLLCARRLLLSLSSYEEAGDQEVHQRSRSDEFQSRKGHFVLTLLRYNKNNSHFILLLHVGVISNDRPVSHGHFPSSPPALSRLRPRSPTVRVACGSPNS